MTHLKQQNPRTDALIPNVMIQMLKISKENISKHHVHQCECGSQIQYI